MPGKRVFYIEVIQWSLDRTSLEIYLHPPKDEHYAKSEFRIIKKENITPKQLTFLAVAVNYNSGSSKWGWIRAFTAGYMGWCWHA